ncbi:2-hydroxychromene-2-carboxylate isomerase [Paraburkholderia kururiensis]|uniref:2-hydroxychromene-2-carboxylate isomerase n=1 Tax=Paraburkholderia kururiensis TaxID=984307 RepID=A0ABZ0WRM6_9BURK|nr:2-hydroxychromene-2-carboxylate isomerase [Paraburkholderia kururiensis]WQD80027.1 2-hydroxychromene-2-carboxylate isomerase [Paraburkholderia kururiensis]
MSQRLSSTPTPPREIELWFDFASNYSYLSVMRIGQAAAEADVSVRWQPFMLGPVFERLGWSGAPFVVQKEKGAYVKRDMERLCAKYGLPWRWPSAFPRRALLPMRVAAFAAGEPWMGAWCREIMQMNFAEDREIDSPEAVREALNRLDLPAGEIVAAALSDEHRAKLRTQTATAIERGIFGAPTFFVGNEMFWGNDRLEDAIAWAAGRTSA